MSLILHIETTTDVCSVALSKDGELLLSREDRKGPSHAAKLGPFVDEAIAWMEQKNWVPDAVAVSAGPGSYTGLRIGVSMAKGLCYAWGIPMIAVSTLAILVEALKHRGRLSQGDCVRPLMDARRMEVYTALYASDGRLLKPVEAKILEPESFCDEQPEGTFWFVGNGSEKFKEISACSNACFDVDLVPLAADMRFLAETAFAKSDFVDVAYFEPYYLKDFVATISKKNVLA